MPNTLSEKVWGFVLCREVVHDGPKVFLDGGPLQ